MGLELVAVTKREDQSDVFLSHKFRSLEELPKNSVIGTTSLRRRMQILTKRADLKVKDLRGNINTRLKKLEDGEYDASCFGIYWIGETRTFRKYSFIPQKFGSFIGISLPKLGEPKAFLPSGLIWNLVS